MQWERMTAQQDSGGGSLPLCDQQLLGPTPKAYPAQSPESAEEAARGHLITNTVIPPVDRSATFFELPRGLGQGEGRAGGWGGGSSGRCVIKAAGLPSLWMLKTWQVKPPAPSGVGLSHPGSQAVGLRDDLGSLRQEGVAPGVTQLPVRLIGHGTHSSSCGF